MDALYKGLCGMSSGSFPFVVIRHRQVTYETRQVLRRPHNLNDRFEFVVEEALWLDAQRLKPEGRESLLTQVRDRAQRTRCRICAVFSDRDILYADIDGSLHSPSEIPPDGVHIGYAFEQQSESGAQNESKKKAD